MIEEYPEILDVERNVNIFYLNNYIMGLKRFPKRQITDLVWITPELRRYPWDGHFYAIRPIEVLGLLDRGGVTGWVFPCILLKMRLK